MASALVWAMACIVSLEADGEPKPQTPKEKYEVRGITGYRIGLGC